MHRLASLLVLALALTLGACGKDDSPTGPPGPIVTPTPAPGTCTIQITPLYYAPVPDSADSIEFWIEKPGGGVDSQTLWELFIDNVSRGGTSSGKRAVAIKTAGPHFAYGRGTCILTPTIVF